MTFQFPTHKNSWKSHSTGSDSPTERLTEWEQNDEFAPAHFANLQSGPLSPPLLSPLPSHSPALRCRHLASPTVTTSTVGEARRRRRQGETTATRRSGKAAAMGGEERKQGGAIHGRGKERAGHGGKFVFLPPLGNLAGKSVRLSRLFPVGKDRTCFHTFRLHSRSPSNL